MNLHQLLTATSDADILTELKARYGDDFDDVVGAHTPVLAMLRSLAPDATSPGALQIDVDETGWHDAGLITPGGTHVELARGRHPDDAAGDVHGRGHPRGCALGHDVLWVQ